MTYTHTPSQLGRLTANFLQKAQEIQFAYVRAARCAGDIRSPLKYHLKCG